MPAQGGNFPLGDRSETWDAGAAEKSYELPEDASSYLWRDPNGDPASKSSYKFPFVSKAGGKHAVWGAITAAAQRLSSAQGVDKGAIQSKIAGYYAKARDKYSDPSIQVPWGSKAADAGVEMRYAVAPITHVDVRDASQHGDGCWTMSGYAAVFNEQTTLFDGKLVRVTESVSPAAFDRVLREQDLGQPSGVVHFNFGHDMNRAVAATDVPAGQPGSLQLRSDAVGLGFVAKVPHDDPDGVAMASKMRSGVLRQASFAFAVGRDEIDFREAEDGPDVEHRTIMELSHLYDVCATPQGAYSQTVSGLRSLRAALEPVYPAQASEAGAVDSGSEGSDPRRRKAIEEAGDAIERYRDFRRHHLRKRRTRTDGR